MDGDRGQAGGAAYGFLAAIGVMVVLLAIFFSACFNSATGQPRSLERARLIAYHNDCRDDGYCGDGNGSADDDRGDCDWNGNCGGNRYRNEYGRGKNGDQGRAGRDQCHSFCNNVIVVPDPTQKKEPPQDQQPQSIACAVPVPWHCDPAPHGFIPPSPGKIPQQIADFAKLISDFVQGVIRFAV